MNRLFAEVMLGSLVLANGAFAGAQSNYLPDSAPGSLSGLPPAPAGKSTIVGGSIRNVDPVRDQFSLNVFGEKPLKVLFDERTQFYRDGKPISLRELGPADHASVQTILDGTNVYALSIHIMSQTPEGECEGRILRFNPATTELAVTSTLSPDPIELLVPSNTLVSRVGQSTFTADRSGFSDLVPGALVSVAFQPANHGRPVVNRISILATPGARFIFAGDITSLNLNVGELDLHDPDNQKSYQIVFNSTNIPSAGKLHLGDRIRVSASYQGTRYVADSITPY